MVTPAVARALPLRGALRRKRYGDRPLRPEAGAAGPAAPELPEGDGGTTSFPFGTDGTMHIELRCPGCPCRFGAAPDAPADEVLDRMIDEGPWFALAGGETFGDMLFAALTARGHIRCPECGRSVSIHEEGRGRPAGHRAAGPQPRPRRCSSAERQ